MVNIHAAHESYFVILIIHKGVEVSNTLKLTGIQLSTPHVLDILEKQLHLPWVEVNSENYFIEGGRDLLNLEKIRSHYPISLHGNGLSLGSADELNWQYLKKLRQLILHIEPALVSDHLAWTSLHGHYFHNLLPLPFCENVIQHIVNRIRQVEDYLKMPILIENIPYYYSFQESEMTEYEFIKQIALQAGCGIVLNMHHLLISSQHLNFNPQTYLINLPSHLIQEIHLPIFLTTDLIDLYRHTILHAGVKPTIIEPINENNSFPSISDLYLAACQAEKLMRATYAVRKLTG